MSDACSAINWTGQKRACPKLNPPLEELKDTRNGGCCSECAGIGESLELAVFVFRVASAPVKNRGQQRGALGGHTSVPAAFPFFRQ